MHALQVYNSGRPPTGPLPSHVAFAVVFATYAGDSSSDLVLKLFRQAEQLSALVVPLKQTRAGAMVREEDEVRLASDRQTATS